jgi:hypothetical protein
LGGADAGPISDTTVFHLASLTKPFASTVILQLVDEGKCRSTIRCRSMGSSWRILERFLCGIL